MPDSNYLLAAQADIMWWPINQECGGCIHKEHLSTQDLQDAGLFPGLEIVDGFLENIPADESPLAHHASRCGTDIVLGKLGTGSYTCPSYKGHEED